MFEYFKVFLFFFLFFFVFRILSWVSVLKIANIFKKKSKTKHILKKKCKTKQKFFAAPKGEGWGARGRGRARGSHFIPSYSSCPFSRMR